MKNTASLCQEFHTAEEIAAYLGIAAYTVRQLCRSGKLRHVRLGRTIRIRKAWADTFAESQIQAPLWAGN
jgi:excisionase family DNA binding protein